MSPLLQSNIYRSSGKRNNFKFENITSQLTVEVKKIERARENGASNATTYQFSSRFFFSYVFLELCYCRMPCGLHYLYQSAIHREFRILCHPHSVEPHIVCSSTITISKTVFLHMAIAFLSLSLAPTSLALYVDGIHNIQAFCFRNR